MKQSVCHKLLYYVCVCVYRILAILTTAHGLVANVDASWARHVDTLAIIISSITGTPPLIYIL